MLWSMNGPIYSAVYCIPAMGCCSCQNTRIVAASVWMRLLFSWRFSNWLLWFFELKDVRQVVLTKTNLKWILFSSSIFSLFLWWFIVKVFLSLYITLLVYPFIFVTFYELVLAKKKQYKWGCVWKCWNLLSHISFISPFCEFGMIFLWPFIRTFILKIMLSTPETLRTFFYVMCTLEIYRLKKYFHCFQCLATMGRIIIFLSQSCI